MAEFTRQSKHSCGLAAFCRADYVRAPRPEILTAPTVEAKQPGRRANNKHGHLGGNEWLYLRRRLSIQVEPMPTEQQYLCNCRRDSQLIRSLNGYAANEAFAVLIIDFRVPLLSK